MHADKLAISPNTPTPSIQSLTDIINKAFISLNSRDLQSFLVICEYAYFWVQILTREAPGADNSFKQLLQMNAAKLEISFETIQSALRLCYTIHDNAPDAYLLLPKLFRIIDAICVLKHYQIDHSKIEPFSKLPKKINSFLFLCAIDDMLSPFSSFAPESKFTFVLQQYIEFLEENKHQDEPTTKKIILYSDRKYFIKLLQSLPDKLTTTEIAKLICDSFKHCSHYSYPLLLQTYINVLNIKASVLPPDDNPTQLTCQTQRNIKSAWCSVLSKPINITISENDFYTSEVVRNINIHTILFENTIDPIIFKVSNTLDLQINHIEQQINSASTIQSWNLRNDKNVLQELQEKLKNSKTEQDVSLQLQLASKNTTSDTQWVLSQCLSCIQHVQIAYLTEVIKTCQDINDTIKHALEKINNSLLKQKVSKNPEVNKLITDKARNLERIRSNNNRHLKLLENRKKECLRQNCLKSIFSLARDDELQLSEKIQSLITELQLSPIQLNVLFPPPPTSWYNLRWPANSINPFQDLIAKLKKTALPPCLSDLIILPEPETVVLIQSPTKTF